MFISQWPYRYACDSGDAGAAAVLAVAPPLVLASLRPLVPAGLAAAAAVIHTLPSRP